MADMTIVEPFDLRTDGSFPSLVVNVAGSGLNNLITPDPRELWQATASPTNCIFTIDLGRDIEWDSIALINTNADDATVWLISSGTQAQNSGFITSHSSYARSRLPAADPIAERVTLVPLANATVTSSSITSTAGVGTARSLESFVGDVRVSARFNQSLGFYGALGLTPTPDVNPANVFGVGYRMYWQYDQARFVAQFWDGAGDVYQGGAGAFGDPAVASVRRQGGSIVYAVNGVDFHTINGVDPALPLYLTARSQTGAGALFSNVACERPGFAFGANCAFVAPAPVLARYIKIVVIMIGPTPLQIGGIVVGKGFSPSLPMELGSGRVPLDSGVRERLAGGGISTVSGSLISGMKWVFGDLDGVDIDRLWGIFKRRRTTEPVVLIEDPGALVAEAFHYGTFVGLEAFERNVKTKSRWAISMEDWL